MKKKESGFGALIDDLPSWVGYYIGLMSGSASLVREVSGFSDPTHSVALFWKCVNVCFVISCALVVLKERRGRIKAEAELEDLSRARPLVSLEYASAAQFSDFRLINIGDAPARNVEIVFDEIGKTVIRGRGTIPAMAVGEERRLQLEVLSWDEEMKGFVPNGLLNTGTTQMIGNYLFTTLDDIKFTLTATITWIDARKEKGSEQYEVLYRKFGSPGVEVRAKTT